MNRRWQLGGAAALALTACTSSAPSGQTDAWTAAAPLSVPRFESYAAAFGSRLYFIGGITGNIGDIASAEPSRGVDIYDAQTNTWTSGPDLPLDSAKHHLAVAVLPDGIYVMGGFDGIVAQHPGEPFIPVARTYALRGSSWVPLAPLPFARGAATAQAIDGKVYVTGGAPTEGQLPFSDLDVYDPITDAWTVARAMPTAREHLASCAVNGKLVVFGGWSKDVASSRVEEYDPQTNTWRSLAPMPTARGGLAAIAQGGRCHVLGGEDWALPFPGTFHVHEVLDPAANTWASLAPMPTARHGFGLALLGGALYAIGGGPSQGNSYTNVAEVYLP